MPAHLREPEYAEGFVVRRCSTNGYVSWRAGAFRVYRDTAELHRSLDELGVLP